jgi:hypothetical protein
MKNLFLKKLNKSNQIEVNYITTEKDNITTLEDKQNQL